MSEAPVPGDGGLLIHRGFPRLDSAPGSDDGTAAGARDPWRRHDENCRRPGTPRRRPCDATARRPDVTRHVAGEHLPRGDGCDGTWFCRRTCATVSERVHRLPGNGRGHVHRVPRHQRWRAVAELTVSRRRAWSRPAGSVGSRSIWCTGRNRCAAAGALRSRRSSARAAYFLGSANRPPSSRRRLDGRVDRGPARIIVVPITRRLPAPRDSSRTAPVATLPGDWKAWVTVLAVLPTRPTGSRGVRSVPAGIAGVVSAGDLAVWSAEGPMLFLRSVACAASATRTRASSSYRGW